MDWQRFRFKYRLRLDDLTPALIQIEAYKEAAFNLVFPAAWQAQLDQLNRVRAIHGTTAIEGNPLSEAEVREHMDSLRSNSAPSRNQSREQRQVTIEFSDLIQSQYIRAVYGNVSTRTFRRELIRLAEKGFIKFSGQGSELIVELDVSAIERY